MSTVPSLSMSSWSTARKVDIATQQGHQRRGLARRLCEGLLAWGARYGAQSAFLQVVAGNAPAIRLYEQLGFATAYRYWYRVPCA